jgi:CxxC motif-containing protein (DUF1111 family)
VAGDTTKSTGEAILGRKLLTSAWAIILVSAAVGVAQSAEGDEATLSAGSFTLNRADAEAYAEPAPVLDYKQQQVFMRGRVHFNMKWVLFPSLGGEWGLGPTFIADKCSECHIRGGRGHPPAAATDEPMSLLVRLSLPGVNEHGGPKPHPNYGDQFQNRGLMGKDEYNHGKGDRAPPEGDLFIDWTEHEVAFADGEKVMLRQPKLRFERLTFGPLGDDIQTSARLANPIYGLGLLEAVPEQTILELAKQQAAQGFKGKPNYVWDHINKKPALGRFGWKANVPSVRLQIALAFHGDIGVTSSIFIEENCPPIQEQCVKFTPNNRPELVDKNWDELEFWTLGLAVPARRNVLDADFKRGEKLFEEAKCSSCHVPMLKTAAEFPTLPQLANQVFHAYTDLLVHDMGAGLADGRPDFEAGPSEWRTPPLWGLGLSETVTGSTAMLHDGRARNAIEAILWHGGEAEGPREVFRNLEKPDREALLKFLNSI